MVNICAGNQNKRLFQFHDSTTQCQFDSVEKWYFGIVASIQLVYSQLLGFGESTLVQFSSSTWRCTSLPRITLCVDYASRSDWKFTCYFHVYQVSKHCLFSEFSIILVQNETDLRKQMDSITYLFFCALNVWYGQCNVLGCICFPTDEIN